MRRERFLSAIVWAWVVKSYTVAFFIQITRCTIKQCMQEQTFTAENQIPNAIHLLPILLLVFDKTLLSGRHKPDATAHGLDRVLYSIAAGYRTKCRFKIR